MFSDRPRCHQASSLFGIEFLQLRLQVIDLRLLVLDLETLREVYDVVESEIHLQAFIKLFSFLLVVNRVHPAPEQNPFVVSKRDDREIPGNDVARLRGAGVCLLNLERIKNYFGDGGLVVVQLISDLARDERPHLHDVKTGTGV